MAKIEFIVHEYDAIFAQKPAVCQLCNFLKLLFSHNHDTIGIWFPTDMHLFHSLCYLSLSELLQVIRKSIYNTCILSLVIHVLSFRQTCIFFLKLVTSRQLRHFTVCCGQKMYVRESESV
jgi:hypothetical protein